MGNRKNRTDTSKIKDSEIGEEKLWIDKIAQITRLNIFGKNPEDKNKFGIILYITLLYIFINIVFQLIVYYQYGWTYLTITPLGYIFGYIGLIYAVWAIRKYRDYYRNTLEQIKKSEVITKESERKLHTIISKKKKYVILLLGLIMYFLMIGDSVVFTLNNPSVIGDPYGRTNLITQGWFHAIAWSSIHLAFIPIIAEFVSMFFGIHIFLPLKMKRLIIECEKLETKIKQSESKIEEFKKKNKTEQVTKEIERCKKEIKELKNSMCEYQISLNLSDPLLFGGMKPIGELFQKSTGLYFIGVALFLTATVNSGWRMGIFSTAFFGGGLILGFILFFAPQILIHNYMKRKKRIKLVELEKAVRKIGKDMEGYLVKRDFKYSQKDINDIVKYMHNYLEYNHADKLKVYSFDISTIRDLMLTAIIPISAEVVIRIYFHYMGM